jgi:brefeldin A-resistance guanine nucleotide exchange factor 1
VETWKRIDRFLPDLRKDLLLEGEEEEAAAPGKLITEVQAVPDENASTENGLEVEQKEQAAGKE